MELKGKRVANGEQAGMCPFKHIGTDRFHFWPAQNLWWCRNPDGCTDCPGVPSKHDPGTYWGNIDYEHNDLGSLVIPRYVKRATKPRVPLPSLAQVLAYHQNLDEETIQYLRDRGIYRETAVRFLVGRNETRLTVPSIVRGRCFGIKKRWIGKPPDGVAAYIFTPGSRGKSVFNWDRLKSRKRWDYFVITKAPLDIMLLEQLGIPAAGPLGGESVWDDKWTSHFDCVKHLINVGDNDDEGVAYVERRQRRLNGNSILAFPPTGKDLNDAYLEGVDLHDWVRSVLR